MEKTLKIVAGFVEKRRRETKLNPSSRKDFLEVLLEYRGNNDDECDQISDHQLHIITMEVFLAGLETPSNTIEWAMVELLRHPAAKEELRRVVGEGNRFEEAQIDDLPYLQAVVKETLRRRRSQPQFHLRKNLDWKIGDSAAKRSRAAAVQSRSGGGRQKRRRKAESAVIERNRLSAITAFISSSD
ncbi:hypothetical protein SASPL_156730 [Salvia splendens]|uniref:Uncharacterized protein n=1 Tax=Salvia splendens TaxID=180675 RepID=A0A8X8YVG0_SALSN|nr:cytochrome P450 76A2-like [Salvia splendens]KAG6383517.1 hypothetical protein SASPL_156730 [Salvia splendens]